MTPSDLLRPARLGLALLLIAAAACRPGGTAPAAGPHPVVLRGAETTNDSRVALSAALRDADRAAVEFLFDEGATLGVPGADDPAGSDAIARYLVSARDGLRIGGYDFTPDRMVQVCTDGERFEHGRVGIRMYDVATGSPARTAEGRYSLRWRERDGRHLITRLTFEEGETIRTANEVACPPDPSRRSSYRAYRVALSLAAGLSQRSSAPAGIRQQLADAGWRQFSVSCSYLCIDTLPTPRLEELSLAVGGEYRVHENVALLADLERRVGETWAATEADDQYFRVQHRYRGDALFLAPEAQWRHLGLAVGPTVTRHAWKSRDDVLRLNESYEANRRVYRTATSTSTAVGMAVQARAGFVLPSGFRLDLALRQRFGGSTESPTTERLPSAKVGGNATTLSLGMSYLR